jgi:phosphohistidine phosphatase
MIELYVVRHARAGIRDQQKWPDDRERPVTADGARRFRPVARLLRDRGVSADVVLSSPLTRAWQTAELLVKEAGWPRPETCVALEPEGSNFQVIEALRPYPGKAVAVVGHEPGLSSLVSLLLTGDEQQVTIDLKKGAVVSLLLGDEPRAGEATLRWLLTPGLARTIQSG